MKLHPTRMITLRELSKRMGLTSSTMLRNYALRGRIPGAVRDPVSGWWLVPADFTVDKLPKKGTK